MSHCLPSWASSFTNQPPKKNNNRVAIGLSLSVLIFIPLSHHISAVREVGYGLVFLVMAWHGMMSLAILCMPKVSWFIKMWAPLWPVGLVYLMQFLKIIL